MNSQFIITIIIILYCLIEIGNETAKVFIFVVDVDHKGSFLFCKK